LVFKVAVVALVNFTEPAVPVALKEISGAGSAATSVLAEKLVTPGLAFSEFLAVIAASRNLFFWAAPMVKSFPVAPEITTHPAGTEEPAEGT
jgi:hypothetical protein